MGSWPAPDANGVQLGWIGPSDGSGLHTDPAGNSPSDDDYLAEGEQHHTAPEPAGIAIWMGIALMGGTAVWYRRRRQQQNTVNGNNTVSP